MRPSQFPAMHATLILVSVFAVVTQNFKHAIKSHEFYYSFLGWGNKAWIGGGGREMRRM